MTTISAKNALDGANVIMTISGIKIGIGPSPGVINAVGYLRSTQKFPQPFKLRFINNSEFNIFTSAGLPIHMDSGNNETMVSDQSSGTTSENVFYCSLDNDEGSNKIDLSQVPFTIFRDHDVYLKNPRTTRSFGLRYMDRNFDNDSSLRSWDIGENQGTVNFFIQDRSPYNIAFDTITGDKAALAKCCTNQFTDGTSIQVCRDIGFTGQSGLCDNLMDGYCPGNLTDPNCACYISRDTVLADKTLSDKYPLAKYTTQPQCWNGDCFTKGYKNAGLRSTSTCPSITVCTQDFSKVSGANNILQNNIVKQDCSTTAIPTTVNVAPGNTTPPAINVVKPPDTTPPATQTVQTDATTKFISDNIVLIFLVFIILIIVGVYVFGKKKDYEEEN